MAKMKDSGIKWIGEIPKEWNVKRTKYEYEIQTGFTPDTSNDEYYTDEDGYTWVSIADISNTKNNEILNSSAQVSKKYIDEKHPKITKKGNLLYSFKLSVGKVAFAGKDLYTNEAIASFSCKKENSLKYLYYASFLIEENANVNIYNAKILNQDLINNSITIIPNYKEQQLIASFLDNKVCKIDGILNDLNKQLDILSRYKESLITEIVTKGLKSDVRMKKTGIDWIGKIPESWIENKIKYIAKVNGRVGFKGYSKDDLVGPDEGAYTIGGKHISTNKLNLDEPEYISWKKYYESPEIMIHKNDIIMAQRGTLGKVVIIEDDIGEATINPSLVLLNKIDINNKFLYWIINSDVIRENINVVNTSTAVPMISQTQIGNFKICIPPRKEQDEIANYLDKKCDEIDKIIVDKQTQIEKIEKYKKSLIYEYVTGKRRVKGAEELYG